MASSSRWRLARPCLAFLLLSVFLVEVFIARRGMGHRLVPDGDMENLYRNEELVVRPNPRPRVVVFGTSRGRGSFLPTHIEERLHLQRGEVLNLAIGGIHIHDAVWLYERNRSTLSKANWIVVQADAFQFSTGAAPSIRFRQMASLEDRLAFAGRTRMRLLLDMIYQSDVVLPHWTGFVDSIYRRRKLPEKVQLDVYGRAAYVGLDNDHHAEEFLTARLLHRIQENYGRYEYSQRFEDEFLRLVQMVKEDGGQLVVFGQPTASPYAPLLRKEKGDLERMFRRRIGELSAAHGFLTLFWDGSDIGLSDRHFRDWGHVNISGARKLSEAFAEWLRPRLAGKPAQTAAAPQGARP